MTSGTEITKKPYHHGSLDSALLHAATQLLEEVGPDALSLREVARRVGVSPNAPYRHYADKEALLRALAHDGFDELAERLHCASTRGGLEEVGEEYVRFALDHPSLFRLMFSGRACAEGEANTGGNAFEVLRQAVALRMGGEATPAAILAAWALVHGLATLRLEGALLPPYATEVRVEALVEALATIHSS